MSTHNLILWFVSYALKEEEDIFLVHFKVSFKITEKKFFCVSEFAFESFFSVVDIKHCHLLYVIICYFPYSSDLN